MMKIRLQRQRRSTATFLLRSLCGLLCAAVAAACSEGTGPRPGSWTSLTAGIAHTCGLTSGGAAYWWGHNVSGQLGDGSTTNRTRPAAVVGGITFASLTAGNAYTCGVTSGGAAYCWGDNSYGALGDGSITNRTRPAAVVGGIPFASLTAGGAHTCGLTSGGAAYCWGHNNWGELGDGSITDRTTPVACQRLDLIRCEMMFRLR